MSLLAFGMVGVQEASESELPFVFGWVDRSGNAARYSSNPLPTFKRRFLSWQ